MKNIITPKVAGKLASVLKFDSKTSKRRVKHCTNPECYRFFHQDPLDMAWMKDHGAYKTKAFGSVKRYRCKVCGKTFSDQSFLIDYYVKKPVDYVSLIKALVSSTGQGNIRRFETMREEQIQNRYERLSRVFLAIHAHLREKLEIAEDFVLDGFESFSRSQYYPNNINIIAGNQSEFIYSMGFSQLRRKGRMTEKQKSQRQTEEHLHGRAPKKAIEMSVASLLADMGKLLYRKEIGKKTLYSDEHPAYQRSLSRIIDAQDYFDHQTISSKKPRTTFNPLFPVNYIDRQIRKDSANHVRETVQFARCPSAMMARLTIYQMYHNYLMPRRVKLQRQGNWNTRGESLKIPKQIIHDTLEQFCDGRPFLNRTPVWEQEEKTWRMEWQNSDIRIGRRIPKYIKV
jgi:hypothetical protein